MLELRDIHLPEPVSWWPPAPGWWFAAIGLVLIVSAVYFIYKRRERFRYRRIARSELEEIAAVYRRDRDRYLLLAALSSWLRRTALCHFPRSECAGLTGERWLEFLEKGFEGSPFTAGAGRCLADGPYVLPSKLKVDDTSDLIALCRRWLETVPVNSLQVLGVCRTSPITPMA